MTYQMSCFQVISPIIVSCTFIFPRIHSFVFLSSLQIPADPLNASISVPSIIFLPSSYKLQISSPYISTLLTTLLQIIFSRVFVTPCDHHTPFNSPIIFCACVTLWPVFLVSFPSLVHMAPRYLNLIQPLIMSLSLKHNTKIWTIILFGLYLFPLPVAN